MILPSWRCSITWALQPAVRSNLTSTWKYETDNGLAVVDYLGSQGSIGALGVPKLVANTALSYEDDTAQFTIRNSFLSAGVNLATVPIENNRIHAYASFDLGARVTVHAGDRSQLQTFANLNKLLDKDPPISSAFSP